MKERNSGIRTQMIRQKVIFTVFSSFFYLTPCPPLLVRRGGNSLLAMFIPSPGSGVPTGACTCGVNREGDRRPGEVFVNSASLFILFAESSEYRILNKNIIFLAKYAKSKNKEERKFEIIDQIPFALLQVYSNLICA